MSKSTPRKGKARVKVTKSGKKVSYGQKGAKVKPGTKKGDAYCARSAKIKGDWKKDPNSPNSLSRKRWKCKGSKSTK